MSEKESFLIAEWQNYRPVCHRRFLHTFATPGRTKISSNMTPIPQSSQKRFGKMTFKFPIRADASLLVGVALLIAGCSRPGSTAGSSALKPIDQTALQTMVDTTARELLIPGAV